MSKKIVKTDASKIREEEEKLAEKPKMAAGRILALYAAVILLVFPVYYRDYYFDIMEAKYVFYWVLSLVTIGICLLIGAGFAVRDRQKFGGRAVRRFFRNAVTGGREGSRTWLMLLVFWVCAGIATLCSDYLYESFWGNEGRYSGLFLITIYCVTTALLAGFGRFRRGFMDLFLLSSLFVAVFGITDFFQLDILGFRGAAAGIPELNHFISSIGNVNNYTAFLALSIAVGMSFFGLEKRRGLSVWYFVLTVVFLTAQFTGQSDNAFLSLAATMALLPFVLFRRKAGIVRYLVLLGTIFRTMRLAAFWYNTYQGATLDISGLVKIVGSSPLSVAVAAIFYAIAAVLSFRWKKDGAEGSLDPGADRDLDGSADAGLGKVVLAWKYLVIAALALLVLVLIYTNFIADPDSLGDLAQYLVFNDAWGTDRGYCWRIGMESYLKQPFLHRLFGFGPDTYGILTWNFRSDSIKNLGVYYESAHNEFLQYLVTIGPVGTAAYILFLAGAVRKMLRRQKELPWLLAPAAAVLAYNIQAIINIGMPIVTPIMWSMMGIGLAGCRKDWKLDLPGKWFRRGKASAAEPSASEGEKS